MSDGATQAPLGVMIDAIDRAQHPSLIKVRTHLPQVRTSAANVFWSNRAHRTR